MKPSQSSLIVAESASASKVSSTQEADLPIEIIAELKARQPDFSGNWRHLAQLEAALRLPSSAAGRSELWANETKEPIHLEGITLRSADLRGIPLQGAFLQGATLAACDLRGVNLRGAQLAQANLTFCDLAEADLTGAHLEEANLDHANLHRSVLNQAVLDGANLASAKLGEARCQQTSLHRAKLVGADLSRAEGEQADFRLANLSDSSLEGARLEEVNLSEADLTYANLQQASMKRGQLWGANLHGVSALGADFRGADFAGAALRQANLGKCDLRHCRGIVLDQTFVTGGEFGGAVIDPWHRLVKTYSWKNVLVALGLFSLFFLPYLLGNYWKSPAQLIAPRVPSGFYELEAKFQQVSHSLAERVEFLRLRGELLAPRISRSSHRLVPWYLVLGGMDGLILLATSLAMWVCLLQRVGLTVAVGRLVRQNAAFRRTPKAEEYFGPYSPLGLEPRTASEALAAWAVGHFCVGSRVTARATAALPTWLLAILRRIEPLWKVLPAWLKTPPASWNDTLGLVRASQLNRALHWGIVVLVLFVLSRWVLEGIFQSELVWAG